MGGREQKSENKRDKERAKIEKEFPTVILSTVAAAQFIHSMNHSDNCSHFRFVAGLKFLFIFQYNQEEFRNKATHINVKLVFGAAANDYSNYQSICWLFFVSDNNHILL